MDFPKEFDLNVYRSLYGDLRHMTDVQLVRHYEQFGEKEGRRANCVVDRGYFASLIPSGSLALEIGPFAAPLLTGQNVKYCDVLNTTQLIDRAKAIGISTDLIPEMDFVLGAGFLDEIDQKFDFIISSHAIEHQPDFIRHLQQAQRRLTPAQGRYFVLVPDKRYCFDRNIAPSTIADVLCAYYEKRQVHTLKSIIEHRTLTTHNNAAEHWSDLSADKVVEVTSKNVRSAIAEWENANGAYVDVHAWYFTPTTFRQIVGLLNELGLVRLEVERIFPTLFGSNEFWVILRDS